MSTILSIKDLHVSTNEGTKILNGLNLEVGTGELHAIMGPNGSGKSTLANVLMGHPGYTVDSGSIVFFGEDITELSPDKRAKMGMFMAFQYPQEIEGIKLSDFLRQSYNAIHGGTDKQIGPRAFKKLLDEKTKLLGIDKDFVDRFVNFGFSGGEKKKAEMLQLAVLQPKFIILDEIDSGLDIDALKLVAGSINIIREHNPQISLIIITHYQRILSYTNSNSIHVMKSGLIQRSGGQEVVGDIEAKGYSI